jgi:hypothetical protein
VERGARQVEEKAQGKLYDKLIFTNPSEGSKWNSPLSSITDSLPLSDF